MQDGESQSATIVTTNLDSRSMTGSMALNKESFGRCFARFVAWLVYPSKINV